MTTYLSAHVISEAYDFSMSTAWAIIREIRRQIDSGRYPPDAVLDGCGTRVAEPVLIDYLRFRKQLKRAPQYVPAFKNVIQPPQIETPMAEIIKDYSKRKEMRH